ncbi:hypothetical protein [Moritella sp.]|nr:hypothetical protein [Moritella sp.]
MNSKSIIDLQTDHVSDAEALVRWHSPTRDLGIHIAIVTTERTPT